ncbi:MAG: hypothetical protein C0491_05750 [Novosphingobium sp.]|nr:hypothetical protein [Novosphingobium sp.]
MPHSSQFAVRCSGTQTVKISDDAAPSVSNQEGRTYVIDEGRKAVYRADPYMVANLCEPNGRCDVEVTKSRATALITKSFGAGKNRQQTETRFVLDRAKGELHTVEVMTLYVGNQPGDPIKNDGAFTCVSIEVPDFKVPQA